jgi:hypothetical protein
MDHDVRVPGYVLFPPLLYMQMDLASVAEGLVARQEAMMDQMADLRAQLANLSGRDQDISIAWL